MPKEYIFEFNGTKEELLNKLNIFPNNKYFNGSPMCLFLVSYSVSYKRVAFMHVKCNSLLVKT